MSERMTIAAQPLEGEHVRLEPVGAGDPALREELRAALDCDPENWSIQLVSARGADFDDYWQAMVGMEGRIGFAVRDRASGRIAGTSSFFSIDPDNRTLEIGGTWLRPEHRGTPVNPEMKLLMLGAAFGAGALRVQFSVDSRNARSQAAVLKLGAVKEGVIRRHRITWTGHRRDTALFSILDEEWPAVRAGLLERLGRGG